MASNDNRSNEENFLYESDEIKYYISGLHGEESI